MAELTSPAMQASSVNIMHQTLMTIDTLVDFDCLFNSVLRAGTNFRRRGSIVLPNAFGGCLVDWAGGAFRIPERRQEE